jgi:arsenite-transporting ATPase
MYVCMYGKRMAHMHSLVPACVRGSILCVRRQALEKAFGMIMRLKDKFGGMLGQFGLADLDFSRLDEFKAVLDMANKLLRDPAHTTFIPVCIPEFLSVYETERLIQELAKFDIDVQNIVVNQVRQPYVHVVLCVV